MEKKVMSTWQVAASIAGVCAFVLAAISLGWQIHTYRDAKKPKVDLEARPTYRSDRRYATIVVKVWNSGHVPVYIEAVEITWDMAKGRRIVSDKVEEVGRALCLISRDSKDEPLQPYHQAREYTLLDEQVPVCIPFADASPDDLALVVRSAARELFQLRGERVHFMVNTLAASFRKEQQEPQTIE